MEHIGEIEKRLWSSADNLRANSNFASNEYFLPVMGLIFLRHAYSRFLKVKAAIEPSLPTRGGKPRALTKEDFSRKGAIFLQPEAQFDHLVSLPDSADRAQVMIDAMEKIEQDYETLRGALPKAEYQELDNDVLGQLLRTFNDPALRRADGDVFGRIYEYFLTQFADQKAHDGGEFFTPVALVQTIVNVIEPDHGRVLDPACGSGGMFVQSAHFIERMHLDPTERATFFGMEKNPTTIRLANMNLAVHGLEGNIHKAITYYEDPHELLGKCDFVMANPPFNVDEVDAEKVKNDPRLPYALPGVNKKGKVSNGNYLWISYFDSYLNNTGRAGFVMSSQASSAGGEEAKVRRKLIDAGHLDVMMAIRSGFFYTRTVPCELWFLDKAKPAERREKVLMIDARNVHREGDAQDLRLHARAAEEPCGYRLALSGPERTLPRSRRRAPQTDGRSRRRSRATCPAPRRGACRGRHDVCRWRAFPTTSNRASRNSRTRGRRSLTTWKPSSRRRAMSAMHGTRPAATTPGSRRSPHAPSLWQKQGHDLIRQADHLHRMLSRVAESRRNGRGSPLKAVGEARSDAVEHLTAPRYFWRQAHWPAGAVPGRDPARRPKGS